MREATVDGTSLTAVDCESASCSCTISRCRSNGKALQRRTTFCMRHDMAVRADPGNCLKHEHCMC